MSKLVGVDVGGTFTDVVAIDGDRILTAKVPIDVQSSDRSVLTGAERVGVGEASVFNLASTAALNAVITRRTSKIAFLTTLGHRDILDRGRVGRPWHTLTDANWRRGFGDAADPLVPRYLRRGAPSATSTSPSRAPPATTASSSSATRPSIPRASPSRPPPPPACAQPNTR